MMSYTDAELEGLLADLEADWTERKESLGGSAPERIREAVCAFANDLPDHKRPGVVFVGATDDGQPSGIAVTDEMLLQLADIKSDGNILPPPTLTVEKRTLLGSPMAIVTVQAADAPPVRYRGRTWIRTGPRRDIATVQDERILNEKRRFGVRPFDVQPVPLAVIGDLDRHFFEETYLPAAVAPDVLQANDRTYEQRLAATKMIASVDSPTPTVVGVLVLGTTTRDSLPGAYVQFLRIAGQTLADDIVDELLIDGTVSETLRRLDDKLISHNRTTVDLTSGPVERRAQSYPLAALQQLVRNAVLHRTYEATNSPVRVEWYDDRIEITNPGGPFGVVTPQNFGVPGVTDYRNPTLAEALRVLGFVQRFGAGIPTARKLLQENGNPPPEFIPESTLVRVVVRRAP